MVCIAFFSSCNDNMEIDSLAGTTWKSERSVSDDGGWSQDVLTFTETEATYERNADHGSIERPLTGTYTYDAPQVTVWLENSTGNDASMQPNFGTVKRKTMTIRIMRGDVIWTVELKKQ